MTDLERVFRHLVANIVAVDPARLHQPVTLGDVLSNIMPYRTSRTPLQVESAEDYDLLLLRLCAGEGRFVQTDPPEAQESFRQEAAASNPDLGLLQAWKDARLILASEQLAYALGPGEEEDFAPPGDQPPDPQAEPAGLPADAPARPPREIAALAVEPVELENGADRCGYCGGLLPPDRTVNFCPHCGESQKVTRCPNCQAELELGWRHCVNCGHPVGE